MYLIIQIINLFINSFGYYLTADGFAENVIYIYIFTFGPVKLKLNASTFLFKTKIFLGYAVKKTYKKTQSHP